MGSVIVTGGAGFIGSHLVDRLIDQGHQVLVIDNFSTGFKENLNPKAKLWEGHVRQFFSSSEPVDTIFHLAALARIQPSFEKPYETYLANATGTMAMLEFARHNKCKLVYAGSSTFYSGPLLNPYAFFKYMGEECCRLYSNVYGVPTVIARFFNVYGPRQINEGDYATVIGIWERQHFNKEPLTITGDGEQRRDFTHVDDIVSGLIAMSLGEWKGEVFNLGTGKNYSLNEVAGMFSGAKVKYIPARPGEALQTLADIEKSKSLLNWRPEKCLTEYCAAITSNF